jgi:Major surface glycoprotein
MKFPYFKLFPSHLHMKFRVHQRWAAPSAGGATRGAAPTHALPRRRGTGGVTQNCHNLTQNCHNVTRNCHNLTRNCNPKGKGRRHIRFEPVTTEPQPVTTYSEPIIEGAYKAERYYCHLLQCAFSETRPTCFGTTVRGVGPLRQAGTCHNYNPNLLKLITRTC